MSGKKKTKLNIVSNHPATIFLNMTYQNYLKRLLPNETDIYEQLEEIHRLGKEKRSPLVYLTPNEVKDFLQKDDTPNPEITDEQNHFTSVILGWKQFQQIYKFNPILLEELYNIDTSNDRYAILSKEEVQYLPCFNFFVEHKVSLGNTEFQGFFVYFADMKNESEESRPQVLFISPKPTKEPNSLPTRFGYLNVSLLYDTDYILTQENADKLEEPFKVSPTDILQVANPGLFNILGNDKAMELIIGITQMITYLAATNADMVRTKKPTKKPDIKRTHITDSEYEVWSIGETLYKGHKIPTRLLDTKDAAYEKNENKANIEEEETNPQEESETYRRKTGYHMRPHMRRAHWTHFWYGKKDGSEERVRRRKFISAVFIDKNSENIQIPTREVVTYRF